MNTRQRLQLRFGPYRLPRFKVGDVVVDECRGSVVITGVSAGPIVWPVASTIGAQFPTPILYAGLVDAVRRESNQAVAHHWGISGQTVTKWRKALGVEPTTEGTSRLRSDHANVPQYKRARKRAIRKALADPKIESTRRTKIANSKSGRKRPRHVVAALVRSHQGKPIPADTRRKMSEAHKRRGTRPPKAGRPWTAKEDNAVRSLSVEDVVELTGRTRSAVLCRRRELALPLLPKGPRPKRNGT